KGAPDNAREERLVFQHRVWLDIRNSLLLANLWGWRTVWPGFPPRKAFFVSAATGALVAALPMSGQVPAMGLGAARSRVGRAARGVGVPGWVAARCGRRDARGWTAGSRLEQRQAPRPAVTDALTSRRKWGAPAAARALAVAHLVPPTGAWAAGWGLEQMGQHE